MRRIVDALWRRRTQEDRWLIGFLVGTAVLIFVFRDAAVIVAAVVLAIPGMAMIGAWRMAARWRARAKRLPGTGEMMTRLNWWLGIALVAGAILLHALVPRYEYIKTDLPPGGEAYVLLLSTGQFMTRVDRWTGTVEFGVATRNGWMPPPAWRGTGKPASPCTMR